MIDANELRKGTTFMLDGDLYEVLEYQHYKPGRGNAIIRTKIRNMHTGAIIPRNFLNGNKFEEAPVERLAAQYLYTDGDVYHFMDSATYDEYHITQQAIGAKGGFLKDGMEVALTIFGSEVLGLDLPAAVELAVVESEMAVAGDTATGASKIVVCETGLKVQVPLFIDVGDVIRVDTAEGQYQTRV
ncbi:MAG: elongation factor P [Anaerolineae bacterium]|jgi:elongation factor P|nr:elongation factor P [Anaerolineae bacterium]